MFLCGRVGKLGKRLRNRHLQDLQPCPCLREPPPERLWLVRSPPVHLLLHGGWKSGCRPQVIEMMTHIEHVYPHVLKVEASSDWCLFALAKFPVPRLTSSCHVSSPADHKCKQGRSQHNSDSKNRSLPSLCSVWIGDYRNLDQRKHLIPRKNVNIMKNKPHARVVRLIFLVFLRGSDTGEDGLG